MRILHIGTNGGSRPKPSAESQSMTKVNGKQDEVQMAWPKSAQALSSGRLRCDAKGALSRALAALFTADERLGPVSNGFGSVHMFTLYVRKGHQPLVFDSLPAQALVWSQSDAKGSARKKDMTIWKCLS